jgi:hypothetical protein
MEVSNTSPERDKTADKEERVCQRLCVKALSRFTRSDKPTFRIDPAMGGLYYRFSQETINARAGQIQQSLANAGIETRYVVKMIESGSEKQIPAYELEKI